MPFYIQHGDITAMAVDAVVNAANPTLLGGGGVDGAIHRAAGPELRDCCATLGGCATGEAKLTLGFRLPARWVIHTVGPIWYGGNRGEEAALAACYRNSLALALEAGCESVAFPLISAGAYGYPKDQALAVAVGEIGAFLAEHELAVTLVVYGAGDFRLPEGLRQEVQSWLDRRLPTPAPAKAQRRLFPAARVSAKRESAPGAAPCAPAEAVGAAAPNDSLDARLQCLDESFSEMLLRKIDERGLTDAACYKRANVDRKHFSKIRSDPRYRPSKPTAIAFAIALELPLAETKELLMKAGFALSPSSKFDVIIAYFIENRRYDIFEINETLFAFDQPLLG